MLDIANVLELLHINNDVNIQIKLFSTLSACLMSNVGDIDEIITYNSMYDKICYIMLNCPLKKATIIFNFLSALIYTVDEDTGRRKALSAYAKNMIRSSGCLAAICELFTSCMMHQDAWRSLCQCLAETCRGVEANQSYCTHLIPMCVQRCSQRNIEVFLVLQSLLHNHTRNINLFIECNGISIFEREFLQHETCLQLLSTLVQSSTREIHLLAGTKVSHDLRDFLRSCGPNSQIGQWATIILYHITGPEGFRENQNLIESKAVNETINKARPTMISDLQCTTDTTRFIQNVMKEILQCTPSNDLRSLQKPKNYLINNELRLNQSTRMRTSQQNIATQFNLLNFKNNIDAKGNDLRSLQESKSNLINNELLLNQSTRMRTSQQNIATQFNFLNFRNNIDAKNNDLRSLHEPKIKLINNELPLNQSTTMRTSQQNIASQFNVHDTKKNIDTNYNMRNGSIAFSNVTMKYARPVKIPENVSNVDFANNITNTKRSFDIFESFLRENISYRDSPELSGFKPKFASTPKKFNKSRTIHAQCHRSNLKYNSIDKQKMKQTIKKKQTISNSVKKNSRPEQSMIDKENKHRSISGWFLETINESCTAFVKTVKNIFRPKIISEDAIEKCSNPASNDSPSCSYSFTNYMKKRDAILNKECTKKYKDAYEDFSMDMRNACSTCNDTLVLKNKLANNEFLKQTIRKLKLGINLYGCDFKKISRQLWPQQTYMTPVVLYSLYRKLIIK